MKAFDDSIFFDGKKCSIRTVTNPTSAAQIENRRKKKSTAKKQNFLEEIKRISK